MILHPFLQLQMISNKKAANRNTVSREAAMLLVFISCWYLEASAEPESNCDKLHSLVVHDSPCPKDCLMRDAGILERQNSYCKFTCLMQTHYLLTSQQMQPAPGGAWCVFDNESPSISSSAKGDSPCCRRSLCNICHRATNPSQHLHVVKN